MAASSKRKQEQLLLGIGAAAANHLSKAGGRVSGESTLFAAQRASAGEK